MDGEFVRGRWISSTRWCLSGDEVGRRRREVAPNGICFSRDGIWKTTQILRGRVITPA